MVPFSYFQAYINVSCYDPAQRNWAEIKIERIVRIRASRNRYQVRAMHISIARTWYRHKIEAVNHCFGL